VVKFLQLSLWRVFPPSIPFDGLKRKPQDIHICPNMDFKEWHRFFSKFVTPLLGLNTNDSSMFASLKKMGPTFFSILLLMCVFTFNIYQGLKTASGNSFVL
jgi:hypothetical protein